MQVFCKIHSPSTTHCEKRLQTFLHRITWLTKGFQQKTSLTRRTITYHAQDVRSDTQMTEKQLALRAQAETVVEFGEECTAASWETRSIPVKHWGRMTRRLTRELETIYFFTYAPGELFSLDWREAIFSFSIRFYESERLASKTKNTEKLRDGTWHHSLFRRPLLHYISTSQIVVARQRRCVTFEAAVVQSCGSFHSFHYCNRVLCPWLSNGQTRHYMCEGECEKLLRTKLQQSSWLIGTVTCY